MSDPGNDPPVDLTRVKELLAATIHQAPEERREYLDRETRDAEGVRREVESLLAAADRLDQEFLGSPAETYPAKSGSRPRRLAEMDGPSVHADPVPEPSRLQVADLRNALAHNRWTALLAGTISAALVAGIIGLGLSLRAVQKTEQELLASTRELEQVVRFLSTSLHGEKTPPSGVNDRSENFGPQAPLLSVIENMARKIEEDSDLLPSARSRLASAVGGALFHFAQHQQAEKMLRLALQNMGPRDNPATRQYRHDALLDLGRLKAYAHHYEEADHFCRTALELAEAPPALSRYLQLQAISCLASVRMEQGDPMAAVLIYQDILDELLATGETSIRIDYTRVELGVALLEAGDPQTALVVIQRAYLSQRQELSPRDPLFADFSLHLAKALLDAGKLDQAEGHLTSLLPDIQASLGPDHPYALRAELLLDRRCILAGDEPDPPDRLQQLARSLESHYRSGDPAIFPFRALVVEAAILRRQEDAEVRAEELIRTMESSLSPNHGDVLATLALIGRTFFEAGNKEAARPLLRAARERYQRVVTEHPMLLDQLDAMLAETALGNSIPS